MIETQQLFGTALKGDVQDLNRESEHRRIGLRWTISGDHLDIEDGPRPSANLAGILIILEELGNHLVSGGVDLKVTSAGGKVSYYSARAGGREKLTRRGWEAHWVTRPK